MLQYIGCNLLLVLTFICLGCQDQELVKSEEGTDTITLNLSNQDEHSFSPFTQMVEKPLVLVNEEGTDSLTFYLTITDTIALGPSPSTADALMARGTPISPKNLATTSGMIALDAFYQNSPFIKDVILFDDNGGAHTRITRYWPNHPGAEVAFWSYYPEEIDDATNADFTITHGESPSLSFHYSQLDEAGNKLVDVASQKDLFLDYVCQGKEDGVVSFQYHHAVSAIRFIAGKTLAGTINRIQLTNVYAGGKLTFTPGAATELSWELDAEPSIIDQPLGVEIDENLMGNPSQAITSDESGTTFLLIPQTVKGKELSVTITRAGKQVTYSAPMPEGTWEMGKTYTYTLKLMDGLGIDASGEVTDGVKIENTYNKACYVRAMILGNWVDAEGNVAAIFDASEVNLKNIPDNTNYQHAQTWSDYWYYDSTNNLYYYKKALPGGQATAVKLFDKFTNPIVRADGLKLDFVVLVQAVEADADKASAKAAWGESIASQIEPLN